MAFLLPPQSRWNPEVAAGVCVSVHSPWTWSFLSSSPSAEFIEWCWCLHSHGVPAEFNNYLSEVIEEVHFFPPLLDYAMLLQIVLCGHSLGILSVWHPESPRHTHNLSSIHLPLQRPTVLGHDAVSERHEQNPFKTPPLGPNRNTKFWDTLILAPAEVFSALQGFSWKVLKKSQIWLQLELLKRCSRGSSKKVLLHW